MTEGGPAEVAGLQIGDKIMQVNAKLRRVPIQYQVHTTDKLLLGELLSSGYFPGQFVGLTNKQLWHKNDVLDTLTGQLQDTCESTQPCPSLL